MSQCGGKRASCGVDGLAAVSDGPGQAARQHGVMARWHIFASAGQLAVHHTIQPACPPARLLADGAWRDKPTAEERFVAAAATNARLIRQAITDFRKDVVRRVLAWSGLYTSCRFRMVAKQPSVHNATGRVAASRGDDMRLIG